jgi:hypothetical protein
MLIPVSQLEIYARVETEGRYWYVPLEATIGYNTLSSDFMPEDFFPNPDLGQYVMNEPPLVAALDTNDI